LALQGQSFADVEVERQGKDGSVIKVSISTTPLRNGEGDIVGVLGIAEDITERKLAQEAVRKSEERYRELVENASDIIYSHDLMGRFTSMNKAGERISGYTREEFLRMNIADIIAPEFLEQARRRIADKVAGGALTVYELEIIAKDGRRVALGVNSRLQLDGSVAVGVQGVARDVTDQKQAEEAVRASEARLAGILNIAEDGIISIDENQRVILYNQGAEKIFGFSEEEIKGQPIEMLMPARFDDRHTQHVRDFARSSEIARRMGDRIEVYGRRKDGSEFPAEISISKLEQKGEIVFTAMVRDISERKQAEVERDTERRLLESLLDQLPVGVLVTNVEGRYVKANQKVCEILGIDSNELTGMTAEEAVRRVEPRRPEGTKYANEELPTKVALQTQRPSGPTESIITTPGGKVRRLVSNATPVMIDGGGLFGSVTVVTDMSEQYALQEQLRQSQKMESIGTLAGGVAHDFNNLLTAILGHTQLAMRKLAPADPLQGNLIEVEKAGTRATTLTRQLLAFSRRQRLDRKTLDLNDTIRDIMKMLRRIIGEDIDMSVQESMDIYPVFADPAQVEQVVMNLAVNARDAMPHGGRLVIDTRNVTLDEEYCREHPYAKPGKYVLMTVSDTGTGMNAETKEHIFEPFFTTKVAGKGTGLGLSMVFGIVKQHEGLIEVYSEVRHGTSFKIYLPVDERVVKEESPEALSPLRGGKETILVAEDEEALRGLARTILEELGYTVLLASDGTEAVDIYQANRAQVSLLVFDIVMPRMGGREAYERILEMGGDVPALFMTGYSAEIVQNQFVAQNQFPERTGSALLQKPYSLETFGRKVREVLDQAKRRSNS
jgi:two-component system, cell cycle sensor histidine kinase and response regulator CckA